MLAILLVVNTNQTQFGFLGHQFLTESSYPHYSKSIQLAVNVFLQEHFKRFICFFGGWVVFVLFFEGRWESLGSE